jgi:hypothetical protein
MKPSRRLVNEKSQSVQRFIEVDFIDVISNAIISPIRTRKQQVLELPASLRPIRIPRDTLRFAGRADLTLHRESTPGMWKITNWAGPSWRCD